MPVWLIERLIAPKWQNIDDFYHLMALKFEICNDAINL
jgi:hypothetical protein